MDLTEATLPSFHSAKFSKCKCGLKPSKHQNDDNTKYKFSILDYKKPSPDEYSLRNLMIPFYQLWNDCASVSTIRHVMALKDIKSQLSILYQYYFARKIDGRENIDEGGSIDKNMEAVILHGYVDDPLFI